MKWFGINSDIKGYITFSSKRKAQKWFNQSNESWKFIHSDEIIKLRKQLIKFFKKHKGKNK